MKLKTLYFGSIRKFHFLPNDIIEIAGFAEQEELNYIIERENHNHLARLIEFVPAMTYHLCDQTGAQVEYDQLNNSLVVIHQNQNILTIPLNEIGNVENIYNRDEFIFDENFEEMIANNGQNNLYNLDIDDSEMDEFFNYLNLRENYMNNNHQINVENVNNYAINMIEPYIDVVKNIITQRTFNNIFGDNNPPLNINDLFF